MVTASVPNELSSRMRTRSPGMVTLAINLTVAFEIRVSPSACCDVPHAVTHVARSAPSCAEDQDDLSPTQTTMPTAMTMRTAATRGAMFMGGRLPQNQPVRRDLHLVSNGHRERSDLP